jgi:hypothetical protein
MGSRKERSARISQRKRRILDVIGQDGPPGVMLYNELRAKVRALERNAGSTSKVWNFNRSFNRTILEFGAPLQHFTLRGYTDTGLVAGIAAREGIWQLIERGYLSRLPAPEECSVVLGVESFSVLGALTKGTRALLYYQGLVGIELVSSREKVTAEELREISTVPWELYHVDDDQRLVHIPSDAPISKLKSLPETALWGNGVEQYLKRRNSDFLFGWAR